MSRLLTPMAVVAAVAFFAMLIPFDDLTASTQTFTTALSVMAAAVLVRLNRGMPSIEWKSLQIDEKKSITAAIEIISKEYLYILMLYASAIVMITSMTIIQKAHFVKSELLLSALSGAVGGIVALCIARMAYVAWRDYDLVRLQRKIIDDGADREEAAEAKAKAEENLLAMRSSGIRASSNEPPRAWSG